MNPFIFAQKTAKIKHILIFFGVLLLIKNYYIYFSADL